MLPIPTLKELIHPQGDLSSPPALGRNDTFAIQTPGGVFHVHYDAEGEVSHLGGIVPFAQFMKASSLFDNWVGDAPLSYASNRALGVQDVLGTILLAMISGHYRFSHVTALRGDTVIPQLLGMRQVASEDSIRRAVLKLVKQSEDRDKSMLWLRRHIRKTLEPLFTVPWTLDIDVTIKPVYGYQPGSVVGYNPVKPGRPSHALHSFVMAQTRLVLDVSVHPGNEHTSNHTLVDLQRVLADVPRHLWPALLRGDCGFGTDEIMSWAEGVGLTYLLKQKRTPNTVRMIDEIDLLGGWIDAGQGWEGKESMLQLSTWKAPRRVVVLRRPDPGPRYLRAKDVEAAKQPKQQVIDTFEPYIVAGGFEYQVLVTNLAESVPMIAQRYRDRADMENIFDEIKNHWGWGGFTSRTFEVTQAVALMSALVYNWWSIFCRLADPNHHREAVTTRPTLLHGIVRQTTHGNQRTLVVTSTNGNKTAIATFLNRIGQWLASWVTNAEQWTSCKRWESILRAIFAGPLGVIAANTG